MSTDKPRLRKVDAGWCMWQCSSEGSFNGHGDTPEEAYEDWEYWNDVLEWADIKPPKDSWLNVGIPTLVNKIKNWREGKNGKT